MYKHVQRLNDLDGIDIAVYVRSVINTTDNRHEYSLARIEIESMRINLRDVPKTDLDGIRRDDVVSAVNNALRIAWSRDFPELYK